MRKDADVGGAPRDRTFVATVVLLATALACSIVVLVAPRPVLPSQLPPLRLSAALLARQAELDRALAMEAARFEHDAEVRELLTAYLEEGLVELEPRVDMAMVRAQRVARAELAAKVFTRLGKAGLAAFRAHTVAEGMQAFSGDRESDRARGLLGAFPRLLATYGYAAADGNLLAPELAVRGLYKARFNLIFELPPLDGFSNLELQAYEGFNALHAGGLPPERRAQSAAAFYRAGGQDGAEAFAIWLYQGEQHADALTLLSTTYEATHALRLRNMALVAARADP